MMRSLIETFEMKMSKVTGEEKTSLCTALVCGLITHAPIMLSDIPNHDGLASMHFNQDMITSGRWFLTVACGISSHYTIPWIIGILGLVYIAIASALITSHLKVKGKVFAALIGMVMASFPALASTFAYVYTLDGYMLGLLLAVTAAYLVGKNDRNWFVGGLCLAFSMGIYQTYLSFAMLLSLAGIAMTAAGSLKKNEKIKSCLSYLYMGITGCALYYITLRILLAIRGLELNTYQGISGLEGNFVGNTFSAIPGAFSDFIGVWHIRALWGNAAGLIAIGVLMLGALCTILTAAVKKKWFANPWFYWVLLIEIAMIPLSVNFTLLLTPDGNYHMIMRYPWVCLIIFAIAVSSHSKITGKKIGVLAENAVIVAALLLTVVYVTETNIGYSNLNKKYEKTYAYCIRLLDRIEQTPGYYQGIPVVILGVIGDEQFPTTDITSDVTGSMTGLSGDFLIYTAPNYESFIRNYLGASLNILPLSEVEKIYYTDEYVDMESFPGESSVKLIDGVICVKTENYNR